jgi:hypothetical protein
MEMLTNQKELTLIYNYTSNPSTSWEYAHNLGHKQGISSWNNDYFTPYLEELINKGIITKVYDFTKEGSRETLYTFSDLTEIEFFGENHMNYRVFYNY